jgi:hypothetical protein
LNRLVDFHEIWYGGNAIQGDLEAMVFNPIPSSTILKWLRFKVVSWRHGFQPFTAMVCCLIVGLLWLHRIQSSANVTMAAIACNLL